MFHEYLLIIYITTVIRFANFSVETVSMDKFLQIKSCTLCIVIDQTPMGAFKNYVDQRGWVGGSPNVNCSNKPYFVKASTRGR